MAEHPLNVLFLCTGNSARSILAEAILNKAGGRKFRAFSAGSQPKGAPHPQAVALLRQLGHDTTALRSKSWLEFAQADAPQLDFIFTVCDNAAGEACPVWPGKPVSAHWGIADPAATTGSDAEIAASFADAYKLLSRRIELLVALPFDKLSAMSLQNRLREIGAIDGATAKAKGETAEA